MGLILRLKVNYRESEKNFVFYLKLFKITCFLLFFTGRGPEGNSYELQLTLETAIDVCNDALHKLRVAQKTYLTLSILFGVLIIVSWFAELFFYIPLDIGGYQVASTVCFNIIKDLLTIAFIFFIIMGTLWNKSEKSAILTGKFSMMTILKRLKSQ